VGNVHEGNGSVDHIGQLKPDTRNPRKHNPRNIGMIVDSLHHVGAARSIVIDEDDNILAGNGVVEAAAQAGIERVRVVEADGQELIAVRRRGLTQEQRQKLKYYDNQTGAIAEWDAGRIAADISQGMDLKGIFDAQELADIMASVKGDPPEDPGPQIDRAAELQEQWKTELGQLWELGDHRLICGDCTDKAVVERVMGGEKARMVWTDPPYGVKYGDKLTRANPIAHRIRSIENDDLPADELEKLIRSSFVNCAEHSIPGASLYAACPAGTPLPTAIAAFVGSGFEFRWQLVWVKDQLVLGRGDYHFRHENILNGWKQDAAHYFVDERTHDSVFEVPRPKVSEEHPTMKPVELVEQMIANSSLNAEVVLDPFLGSGTTLIACERLGRKCRAIEISPAYVAVALQRWTDMTGRSPVLVD